MVYGSMEFIRSRSFLLALISTVLCLFIFYGYGIATNKDYMLLDISILVGLFGGLNIVLFYFVHSNHAIINTLNLSEDRLQYALDASGEGIYDWDIKSNEVFYSKRYIQNLGYTPEEFGSDISMSYNLIHEDDREYVSHCIEEYIEGNLSEYSIEFRMYHKDGHIIWVNSSAHLIKTKSGEPLRLIGTHRDITASKIKEENLIETLEESEHNAETKTMFLAHMSHEIRTPLTAIAGIAEILQKQSEHFNDKQKKLIKTLSSSSQSLKELINDILDFSKIEKGDVDLDYSYFSLADMIAEIISMMSVVAKEKNINFQVIYDDVNNLQYFGDKSRIRQILINLIGNAIKFTDTGQVKLLIEKVKHANIEHLDFIVQDTGIGINDVALERIFEEFHQADKSISRKYGGTGLGLPISKKLAALMGGDISVKSKENIGSTFTLTLPMADKYKEIVVNDNDNAHTKIAERLSSVILGEQRILLVDDYDGNIVILTYLMEEVGLEYDIAENGEEAIKKWKSKHYDIILMDVQMPIMDGLKATEKIRRLEKENNFDVTPIIGMTAHALVEDKQKCVDAGMTDYLSKPIDSQKLKEKMYYHLYNKEEMLTSA